MSVAQNTGIRKAVTRLLVAMAACTAVAAGAAVAASPGSAPVTPHTVAGVADDNGWPVPPVTPGPTN
ncbi:hypothetical protein [Streptomyces sp. TLI_105]|uniref:hypothetical protein n=1 Tax=Streptomyces sp. TLI_105 TaxID=1881019 RepID=UPI000899AE64|nr:hypothetical protein [Streptomyces sp. TLI_105]SEC81609.1 hypothetical protein SAMN05428939_3355 [Streptomyces sp. TLI_105]